LAQALEERGFRVVSGGTDTALFLLDLTEKEITGKEAQLALDEVGITVNKNTIPFEKRSPFVTSGIRVGTPSVTTRGMKEKEMPKVASLMRDVLTNLGDERVYRRVQGEVYNLCQAFPLYPELG